MALKIGIIGMLLVIGAGLFFFAVTPRTVIVERGTVFPLNQGGGESPALPPVPESPPATSTTVKAATAISDIGNQKPLPNPPSEIRGIYATNWSAGSSKKMDYLTNFIQTQRLNAIIIDIKDYSGYVGYITNVPDVKKYEAEEARISKINSLIKSLHEKGIYVIGRLAVFQDQALIKARPDLAVKRKSTGEVWRDKKGLGWVDTTSRDVWDYDIAIAKDAFNRGFDEVNFDYVRFPSDGNLDDLLYPVWDMKTSRVDELKKFFSYVRSSLQGHVISADIFGLATINHDDLGIGQHLEEVLQNFDYVAPMVYPSHYANGFLGYANPANYPYEVVNYSIQHAVDRLNNLINPPSPTASPTQTNISPIAPIPEERLAKIRPWLQAFDLGAVYDAAKIEDQIRASKEAGGVGYMLWSPSNNYIHYE